MFNKDIKVPLQEAELVHTSSSNRFYSGLWKVVSFSKKVGIGIFDVNFHCCQARRGGVLSCLLARRTLEIDGLEKRKQTEVQDKNETTNLTLD